MRILLADNHAVVRLGLRLLIDNQAEVRVVGEAGDGQEALAKARELQPDIILLDNQYAGYGWISRYSPAAPSVTIQPHLNPDHVR